MLASTVVLYTSKELYTTLLAMRETCFSTNPTLYTLTEITITQSGSCEVLCNRCAVSVVYE